MATVALNKTLTLGRGQAPAAISVYVSRRHESGNVAVRGQSSNLAAYRRGTGGRSSFSGIVATVFGATGFMGRHVVNRLGKIGSQVIIPYRGDPYWTKDLKLAGDLGQILFLPMELKNEDSLRKAMKYSNVVINLIGLDIETKNFSFKDVNVTGVQRIARLAKEVGVEKFIHLSHLNASPNPTPILTRGGSEYLKTKYYGDLAVREEFPEAVIFKPSDIFGADDRFLRYYGQAKRRAVDNFMPLWRRGTETVKMPVFCSDLAEGIIAAAVDPDTDGKTYEAVGPRAYLLSELVDYFFKCMRYDKYFRIPLASVPYFRLKIAAYEKMVSNVFYSSEKLEREHVSDKLTGLPTLKHLGVNLTGIEDEAFYELKLYRRHNYYEESVGEFPDPDWPKVYTAPLF